MNKFLTLLFVCVMGQSLLAEPISQQKALQYAQDYLQQKSRVLSNQKQRVNLNLVFECKSKASRSLTVSDPLYYVFNRGEKDGFIVISGDDRMKPVLGCVDEGEFQDKQNHPGMQWWLDMVEQTMMTVMNEADDMSVSRPLNVNTNFRPYVRPLVTTKWGQAEPFNLSCPYDARVGKNALVGCVAVAMGQVLNKWKYPLHPNGEVDYVSPGEGYHIHENLNNFTFDWDNILDEYGPSSSSVEKKAVSDFLYACGVAVDMDYSCTNSGTLIYASALEEHFGIDKGCNRVYRVFFTTEEWDNLMKTELNAGRPVIYNAFSAYSGHSFVCDGYNESGLFHINWGWEGRCNGYFELSALNSKAERAGEPTDGVGCYNFRQSIVYGIQPENAGQANVSEEKHVYYNDVWIRSGLYRRNSTLNVKVNSLETDDNCFRGYIGFQLFDANGNICNPGVVYDEKGLSLKLNERRTALNFRIKGSDLPLGRYYLKLVSMDLVENKYRLVRPRYGANNRKFVPIIVNSDGITVLDDSDSYISDLKVVGNCELVNGKAYAGFENDLRIRLHNDGAMFNGKISIKREVSGELVDVGRDNLVIEANGDATMSIRVKAPQGIDADKLYIYALDYSRSHFDYLSESLKCIGECTYPLARPVSGAPVLVLDEYRIGHPSVYAGDAMTVDFALRNDGGLFADVFSLVVADGEGGEDHVVYKEKLTLNGGESVSKSVKLDLSNLKAHKYSLVPCFVKDGISQQIPGQKVLSITLKTFPQNGDFVRIKTSTANSDETSYLTLKQNLGAISNLQMIPMTENGDEFADIFYCHNNQLLAYKSGNYLIHDESDAGPNGVVDEGLLFDYAETLSSEVGAFNISYQSGTEFLMVDGDRVTSVSNADDMRCHFNVESVKTLPVKISKVKHATLYAPVALKIPENVSAYIGQRHSDRLSLVEISDVIPANTAVILIGEPGTYDFEITTDLRASYRNDLEGNIASMLVPEGGVYTLQCLNNKVGLFKFNGTTLHGFRVYLPCAQSADPTGFSLGYDDVTGIENTEANGEDEVYYDLNGRRVYYPSHGVFVNKKGKKFYFK